VDFVLLVTTLFRLENDESDCSEEFLYAEAVFPIARHLTALNRPSLSAPIQILNRFGFLNNGPTIFDYGCGRGDDVRGLNEAKVPAKGWDPYFASQAAIESADIVNLGFVINVIEDPVERREALLRAYDVARMLLVVSTMIASDEAVTGTPFGDGVLTKRRTFQKYYTQPELLHYVEHVLKEPPIPVAPGICFIFRDKKAEQRFQMDRHRSRLRMRPIRHRTAAPKKPLAVERPSTPKLDLYEQNRALFDELWRCCLELGRLPQFEEVSNPSAIKAAAGGLKKALNYVRHRHDPAELERAHRQRSDDLLVFFALQLFQRRAPYKQLEPRLQRDVRTFFGSYASALTQAQGLLTKAADPKEIDKASLIAAERGIGWFQLGKSLELHSSLVERLPPVLRVYVNCAAVLYGDLSQVDVIKIHIASGKVTLSKYDKFWEAATPKLLQRTKINLRTLGLQVFDYGNEYASPLLYLKSRLINEECLGFADQLAFDEKLQELGLVDLSKFGPDAATFSKALKQHHWKVDGLRLGRLHYLPDLDEMCGRYLTYRQLIECGDTQKQLRIPNLPKDRETYTALYDLANHIIDPVIDYFGQIELTYGFCSQALARKISGRIAPALDQHAAHENRQRRRPSLRAARRGGRLSCQGRKHARRRGVDLPQSAI
jgi:DNA phosphorothioation-associated putative methyltransferase